MRTKNLKIPKGLEEAAVLATIEKVVGQLARNFRFGYFDIDDMKQQGRLFALEALERYDSARPLENFLYTHVRNRYLNFKRDNFSRYESPCPTCPFYDPQCKKSINQCAAFEDKMECPKFAKWKKRNDLKKNLAAPIGIVDSNEVNSGEDFTDEVSRQEVRHIIDKNLSVELRADYQRILSNVKIPRNRYQKVSDAIQEILVKEGIINGEE